MCGDKEQEQPGIRYSQPPEDQLFTDIQKPWMKDQFGMFKDVFEPLSRSLGGQLGEELKTPSPTMQRLGEIVGSDLDQPLTLPTSVWEGIKQRGMETIKRGYESTKQDTSERLASRGMLEQGPGESAMKQIERAEAESVEDYVARMTVEEWNEKKMAKQQSIQNVGYLENLEQLPIQNIMQYLGYQPQFNLPQTTAQPYTYMPPEGPDKMGGAMSGAGTGATVGSALGPWGTIGGAAIGGTAGYFMA